MRGRTLAAALLLAVLAGLAAVNSPPAAHAAQQELTREDLGLEVRLGYEGKALRGGWIPVEVELSPSRLFAGTLTVLSDHDRGRQSFERDIEVAASSTKLFRFVMPPSHTVTVQLTSPDTDGLRVNRAVENTSEYLVAVVGEHQLEIGQVRHEAVGRQAAFVHVAPEWFSQPKALDALSAVIATPEELARLDEDGQEALRTALRDGLDLVIVPPSGAADLAGIGDLGQFADDFPAEAVSPITLEGGNASGTVLAIAPAPNAWALHASDVWDDAGDTPIVAGVGVGRGRLLVAGTAPWDAGAGADARLWSAVLSPTHRINGLSSSEADWFNSGMAAEGLRGEGGLDIPPLRWFVIFLVAYLLLVGPLNGLVLARLRRRELAWVTIPAITLLFAGVAWISASSSSPSVGLAGHAAWWLDGTGSETVVAALRSPRPDTHELRLSGDWAVTSGSWNRPTRVATDGDDTVVAMDLEAMEVGMAMAERPLDTAPPLDVTAEVLGDEIHVDVRNISALSVEDLRVVAATSEQAIEALGPGERTEVVLKNRGVLPLSQDPWGDPFSGLRGPNGESPTAPNSLQSLLRWSALDRTPGTVWVAGTTTQLIDPSSQVVADGTPAEDRGTYLAVGVTPSSPDEHISPFEMSRQLLVGNTIDGWQQGPLMIEGQIDAILRFRIPPGGTITSLEHSLDRGQMGNGGGVAHECRQFESRDDEDNLIAVRDVCAPVAVLDDIADLCPAEAQHCALEGQQMVVCMMNGPCENEVLDEELLEKAFGPAGEGLEVWDHAERTWIRLERAFAPADEEGLGGDPARLVGPLGEVLVRASGQLFPFDFSGRGLSATRSL